MKWGVIGKDNDKGLGTLTRATVLHLQPDKVYCLVDQRTTKQIEGAYYANDLSALDEFLEGLNTVLMYETPHQGVIRACRERGIKTILVVNYEFLPETLHRKPDLFVCSSSVNYDAVPYANKVLIPQPTAVEEFPFKQRKRARVFLHNAGTLGVGGANGTEELIKAMHYVKSPAKLIVNSQVPLDLTAPNTEIRVKSYEHPSEMFQEGDVFISPQKFRATSHPIQEAMASGLPVLVTDIQPFNEFCQFTFPSSGVTNDFLSRPIKVSIVDPKEIAKAIDALYDQDIAQASKKARQYAESISWRALQERYMELI